MLYRKYGASGPDISVLGLGGHEFHENGKLKGFSDNLKLAVTAGHVFSGFGGDNRESIVSKALDSGINFFDVTIDSEKEAMGRLLKKLRPSQEVYIQTRPEGMVYAYDPENRKMADYKLLKEEAARITRLIGRETIDILNIAFMKSALDADPDYMEKIGDNIRRLKKEGLIRFASADTFSGNDLYIRQIDSGYFDSIFINYNITEKHVEENIIPEIKEKGMPMLCRELFVKGTLFRMADEAGITDKNHVARAAIKWILKNQSITSVMVGISNVQQLENNLIAIDDPAMTGEDQSLLNKIFDTALYKSEAQKKRENFYKDRL